jgi:hypothetical protein
MSLAFRRSSQSSPIDSSAETEAGLMRSAVAGSVSRRELIRRGRRAGLGLAAVAALAMMPRESSARTSRPRETGVDPNCVFVCCDGGSDCLFDGTPMCLKCYDRT